jgi:hypothetical protein
MIAHFGVELRMRLHTLLALSLVSLFALVACGDDESPPRAPTATPTATATADVLTPAALTATATAPALPPVTQRVIDAVRSRDLDSVMATVQMTRIACTNRPGAGGPPKCSVAGTSPTPPEGATIEAFPLGSCELGWYARSAVRDIVQTTLPGAGELYAVVRLSRPLFSEPGLEFPTTKYAAFFVRRASGMPESSFVFATDDTALTYIDLPCAQSARDALANPIYRGAEVILRGPAFQP